MKPKLFSIIKHRDKELTLSQLRDDIISGVIVAVIALPLSVALAIASGVTPEKGLVTAIIAGFFISCFGGSRVQIGGPTGAFVVIIYGIIAEYGLDGLLISTLLAGVFMIILGVLRLGNAIKYVPYPTTTGFTSGIALVLISTQVKDFFGLNIAQVPSEFIAKWSIYIQQFGTVDFATTLVGIMSLLIIVVWPKFNKVIPGSLIALISTTIIVQGLGIHLETIGSRFGDISGSIAFIGFSAMDIFSPVILDLIRPAITIAFLASIESLLSAVVADGMIGKKHNSNMELIGQGMANIASALFGGIPATGAIARTAANVKNGGRTPIAGIIHSLVLLLILLIFMPLAKLIPMATLSSILIVVAYNMSEWRSFKAIFFSTKSDVAVLLATFILTVLFDLVVAIEIGMVIAMFLFVRRMSDNELIQTASHDLGFIFDENEYDETDLRGQELKKHLDSRISVYEISGPFFFGVVNRFLDMLNELKTTTKVIVLNMKNANSMDATALNAMNQLEKRCRARGRIILYAEAKEQPLKLLEKSGFVDRVGSDRFFNTNEGALQAASEIIASDFKSLDIEKIIPLEA